MAAQVALKRQQAAEDAIALNMRVVATGDDMLHLPQGPIVGLPHGGGRGDRGQESNAERRIRGKDERCSCVRNYSCYYYRGRGILQKSKVWMHGEQSHFHQLP